MDEVTKLSANYLASVMAVMLVTLLPCRVAYAGASCNEKHLDHAYWALQDSHVLRKAPTREAELYPIAPGEAAKFTVEDCMLNEDREIMFRARTESGATVYLYAVHLRPNYTPYLRDNCSIDNIRLFQTYAFDPIHAETKCKEEKAAAAEARQKEISSSLSKSGIHLGKALWLREPYTCGVTTRKISGLTKGTISSIQISPSEYIDVTMQVSVDGENCVASFGSVGSILASFTTEDLTKKSRKWSKPVKDAIKKGTILLGMSREQVRLSWGRPFDINESIGRWGRHEQWVYGDSSGPYIYFENGKLTSWQD